jgi:hypothetical protein
MWVDLEEILGFALLVLVAVVFMSAAAWIGLAVWGAIYVPKEPKK